MKTSISPSLLNILALLGVAMFAVSGALAAGHANLDLLGVPIIAAITAIGGGTLRDLLLSRHPIFWIKDRAYLYLILVSTLLTVIYTHFFTLPQNTLLIADALGLALFALCGAEIAESAKLPPLVIILMGTMTGVAGGLIRDVLCNNIPLILREDIYATAAIAGIAAYLLLQHLGLKRPAAFWIGLGITAGFRLYAIGWGLQLPTFHLP